METTDDSRQREFTQEMWVPMKHKDSNQKRTISRRDALQGAGSLGLLGLAAAGSRVSQAQLTSEATLSDNSTFSTPLRKQIFQKVQQTPFIDTHEHLQEERKRLKPNLPKDKSDDWSFLLSHYLDSDMQIAGMPEDILKKFLGSGTDPLAKWSLLEPYWPAIKNTGYGRAVALSIRELYGVEELSAETIGQVQAGYEKTRRPGFYRRILRDYANIESCQINNLSHPFTETAMPDLLMQDLSILGMIQSQGRQIEEYAKPANIEVKTLDDWHHVIDWWFEKYGSQAVAVKSQHAYSRDIDYVRVDADQVADAFAKHIADQSLAPAESKALEDHLFWYAVIKATQYHLPVKLHTGYYAGVNRMPLDRLMRNPGSASDLCRLALEHDDTKNTRFVFMHISYPYYEPMIALAKGFTNAFVDMCWSWIINPIAAKDFLKKLLLTAPANKILTFGGDYKPVEVVLGHAIIARRGIALALSELVEDGWIPLKNAIDLIPLIMHENARQIFRLDQKPPPT